MPYKVVYHEAHPQEREVGNHIHIYFFGSPEEVRKSKQEIETRLGKSLDDIACGTFDNGKNYQICLDHNRAIANILKPE